MPDRIEGGHRRILRAAPVLAGALALTELAGAGIAAGAQEPQPIVREGQLPPSDGPVTVFTSAQLETSASILPVQKIRSKKAAAERFGADRYSKDPSNWTINRFGGATLKDDPTGNTHRVSTNGAVFEGYVQAPRAGIDSIVFVVNPNDVRKMDFNSATAWVFKPADTEQGFRQVKRQVTERLAREQRGVNVEPANEPRVRGNRSVTPTKIRSRGAAAEEFGADRYSKDPDNWRVNRRGGSATLVGDPSGDVHRINVNGEVAEGYINIDRVRGTDAMTVVAMNEKVDVVSATVWKPRKRDQLKALFKQVLGQNKKNSEGGVLVIPIS